MSCRGLKLWMFLVVLLVIQTAVVVGDTVTEAAAGSPKAPDAVDKPTDETAPECENPDVPLITLEELNKYNGKIKGEKIYLSVLGFVYDVTKGKQYYAEGSGYHIFAGRDGAVPFVTGNFTEEEASKSTDELTDVQLFQLKHWDEFYKGEERYPLIGKVIGVYFDSEGNPTEELKRARKRIAEYVPPAPRKRRRPKTNKNNKSTETQAKSIKGE